MRPSVTLCAPRRGYGDRKAPEDAHGREEVKHSPLQVPTGIILDDRAPQTQSQTQWKVTMKSPLTCTTPSYNEAAVSHDADKVAY